MMKKLPHFGRVDLQEAYLLFGLVNVDFDETYPHNTVKLQAWIYKWEPCITRVFAVKEGMQIRVTLDDEHEILCVVKTQREIIVEATVVLLNLFRSQTTLTDHASLRHILSNIFSHFVLVDQ